MQRVELGPGRILGGQFLIHGVSSRGAVILPDPVRIPATSPEDAREVMLEQRLHEREAAACETESRFNNAVRNTISLNVLT